MAKTPKKIRTNKRILNLGAEDIRHHSNNEEFTIDIAPAAKPDVVWDLRKTPWPIEDNQFDIVYAENIIEHLPDTCAVMQEIWRVCKDGAKVKIIVPHYTGFTSWSCPEHYKTFTSITFDYFNKQFDVVKKRLKYSPHDRHPFLWKILDWLINRNYIISDRFGSLIGGIAEIRLTLRAKKKVNLDGDEEYISRGHIEEKD
ncbi:methyltransferase domain-containing protein [Candidatus Woesearchaeota archaeon]|jgi:SAM-dependent methyltransferase|nr:methyltransferase domain-containing protein [Candidatus Woesearchaeota archaeon]MBT6044739.1 methyltransferase domain-containing protein [Candidatus Woesearchaeota archaeon]